MNTYCPGCNKPLKRKQLTPCKFTLTKQDDPQILDKIRNGNDEDKDMKKKKKKRNKGKFRDSMTVGDMNLNKEDNLYECGSCGKVLTNAIRSACLSKCGHVVCLECIKKFVAVSKSCSICDEPCKKKHVIILSSGGTGYAAHGNQLEATKKAVAFQ